MGFLNRIGIRRRPRDTDPPTLLDDQAPGETDIRHRGLSYRPCFERQPMPDPGAQNYAYTTLALMPQTVIGTGFVPRAHMKACQGGMFGRPLVKVSGLGGTQNSQIYSQPLIDPETGAVGGVVAAPYGNVVR